MPNVTVTPRQMGNGDVVSQFIDSVGTTPVTYTYPKTQEKFIMRNMGPSSLSVTIAGVTQVIPRGEKWQKVADFTSFSINAVSGYVAFDAWADEKGSTFDSAEGQYFAGGVPSSGGTGVSVYATLSDLQAALPGGSTTPAWVTADNSWYYWNGVVTADTTPPTISANPVAGTYMGTQTVTLTANETANIYYTTDGSTPTVSSTVYSSAISVSATSTIKAIGKDTAGNVSTPVSFAYTITVVTIPATPTTPTATPGNNKVDLTWTAVSGAASYKVYRGGTLLASPTTNSYSDTTALNGTTYSYTVSAVNSAGESSQSTSASATPSVPADTTPPVVSISPVGGTYSTTQSITLSATDNSGGAVTIYYTTDGTTPDQTSAVYSSPISVPATATIKYFGKDPSSNVSTVQTAVYTINASTVIVSDDFNRADGAIGTAVTGQAWILNGSPAPTIISNQIGFASASSAYPVIDSTKSDNVDIELDLILPTLTTGNISGITARLGANNSSAIIWGAKLNGTKVGFLNTLTGVAAAPADANFTFVAGQSYRLKMEIRGNVYKCYVDGVLQQTYTDTANVNLTGTKHGFVLYNTAVPRADNFKVTSY